MTAAGPRPPSSIYSGTKGGSTRRSLQALSAQAELPEQVKWGVIAHLAQTPCRLVLLSLEDIFGWLDQQNLPGTKDEYPNWRLKLPLLLEEIAQAPEPEQAAQIMRRFRLSGFRHPKVLLEHSCPSLAPGINQGGLAYF